MLLSDCIKAKQNFVDADFWIIPKGDKKGFVTLEFHKSLLGIKVKRLDILDPSYLYYLMQYHYNKGLWNKISYKHAFINIYDLSKIEFTIKE